MARPFDKSGSYSGTPNAPNLDAHHAAALVDFGPAWGRRPIAVSLSGARYQARAGHAGPSSAGRPTALAAGLCPPTLAPGPLESTARQTTGNPVSSAARSPARDPLGIAFGVIASASSRQCRIGGLPL
jgi:hypothetical protein